MTLTIAEIAALVAITNVFTSGITAWVNTRMSGRKNRSDEDHASFTRMKETVDMLGKRVDELSRETREQREELHTLRTENAVLKEGRESDKARIALLEDLTSGQRSQLEQIGKSTAAFLENFRKEGCPAGGRCPMVGGDA